MKFIKKFENFTNDENRNSIPEEQTKYNPKNSLAAKTYVEAIFNKGGGAEVTALVKEIGLKLPRTDEELEQVQQQAIEYFTENPERIRDFDQPVTKYQHGGGSNMVTTNNIGGTSQANSTHVGESFNPNTIGGDPDPDDEFRKPTPDNEYATKIDLTDEDMDLFNKEASLKRLISSDKITLLNKELWYIRNDRRTSSILDIFFDLEEGDEY